MMKLTFKAFEEIHMPMDIKPIKNKRDYEAALKAIEPLMTAKRNSLEGDKLEVLVTLVESYEAKNFPLDYRTPWRRSSS